MESIDDEHRNSIEYGVAVIQSGAPETTRGIGDLILEGHFLCLCWG